MDNGDIVVCAVSVDVVIEDISCNVPRQVPVTIAGDRASKSKDLWRYLSQGTLFRLDIRNVPQRSLAVVPEVVQDSNLVGQTVALSEEVSQLRSTLSLNKAAYENSLRRLQDENVRLRLELDEERVKSTQLTKLDDILGLLQKQPVRSVLVMPQSAPSAQDSPVDDSAPKYIPSQIKSDAVIEGGTTVQESRSDGGSVSSASKALRDRRKGQ